MNLRATVVLSALPFAIGAGGCSGTSGGAGCPTDPECYVVSPDGECSVDPGATCMGGGTWLCSLKGKLGSGCFPDGGIAPPPPDAGACPLATLHPPLACDDDATCAPYGGHCEFDQLTGAGDCACGSAVDDAGPDTDACVGPDCYRDYCGLPGITLYCNGPDDPSCSQYGASCLDVEVGADGGSVYVCACDEVDPPHGEPGVERR